MVCCARWIARLFRWFTRFDKDGGEQVIDTVKGVFIEGGAVYEGSRFYEKTHIQIAVCNPYCIKGVFRVPDAQLRSIKAI